MCLFIQGYIFRRFAGRASQYIAISLFHASTCFEHHVLIVRRIKLYYTASGIITPIGGRPVHGTATYRCDDTRGCIIQFLTS